MTDEFIPPTTVVIEYEDQENNQVYKNHDSEHLEPEYFYQEYILLSIHNARIAEQHRNFEKRPAPSEDKNRRIHKICGFD